MLSILLISTPFLNTFFLKKMASELNFTNDSRVRIFSYYMYSFICYTLCYIWLPFVHYVVCYINYRHCHKDLHILILMQWTQRMSAKTDTRIYLPVNVYFLFLIVVYLNEITDLHNCKQTRVNFLFLIKNPLIGDIISKTILIIVQRRII